MFQKFITVQMYLLKSFTIFSIVLILQFPLAAKEFSIDIDDYVLVFNLKDDWNIVTKNVELNALTFENLVSHNQAVIFKKNITTSELEALDKSIFSPDFCKIPTTCMLPPTNIKKTILNNKLVRQFWWQFSPKNDSKFKHVYKVFNFVTFDSNLTVQFLFLAQLNNLENETEFNSIISSAFFKKK